MLEEKDKGGRPIEYDIEGIIGRANLEIEKLKKVTDVSYKSKYKKYGDAINLGDPLIEVFLPDEKHISLFEGKINNIFTVSSSPPEFHPFILERIKPKT